MKKLLLALFLLLPVAATAQQLPADSVWGNPTASANYGTSITIPNCSAGALGYNTSTHAFGCFTRKQQLVITSSGQTLAQASTAYMLNTLNATEANVWSLCPYGTATFRNLYVQSTAPAVGQTLTATFRVAGSDTALTCAITGAGTTCNDTTHTATCTAGQTYSLKVVTSATSGTMNTIAAGIEINPP